MNSQNKEEFKLDQLKHKWFHSKPSKLYDLCIKTLCENINLILVPKSSGDKTSVKYKLSESIGPLPCCITESLLKQYLKYYLNKLSELERDEYFNVNKNDLKKNNYNLTSYYDLLTAFVSRPDIIKLSRIDYRQCEYQKSTLEQRLKQKYLNQLSAGSKINSFYFKIKKLNSKYDLKSLRSRQKPHFTDKDIKKLAKNHKSLSFLELCPCELSNKSVVYINKYLFNDLKYLRLKNCCNRSEPTPIQQGQVQQQDENLMFQFNNDLSDLESVEEDLELEHQDQIEHDQNLNNFLFAPNEEEDEDDDEDDANFDAYLKEYVNRYKQSEPKKKCKKKHHHHKHRKRLKCRKSCHKKKIKNMLSEDRGVKECKLFKPCKIKYVKKDLEPEEEFEEEEEEDDKETSSILKWLIKRAVKQEQEQEKSKPSSSISLIEQIKKKASFLADTKMLDKVSISSSNFDEQENLESQSNKNLSIYTTGSDDSRSSSCSSLSSTSISLLSSLSLLSSSSCSCSSCSSDSSTSRTSCSSFSTSSSSSSSDFDDYRLEQLDQKQYLKRHINKKVIRQQKLLEKVANLGSSPINVIQAIAAKALNFKLKNTHQLKSETSSKSNRRLIRHYKFIKSSNIKHKHDSSNLLSQLMNDLKNEEYDQEDDDDDELSEFKQYKKKKRLKEDDTSEFDMETQQTNSKAGTSKSFDNQSQSNSNLFSVLKYWMSKKSEKKEEKKPEEGLKQVVEENKKILKYSSLLQTINLSNLEHLSLRNLGSNCIKPFMLNKLLNNFKCLKYLDISNCCTNQLYLVKKQSDLDSNIEPQSSAQTTDDLYGCLYGLMNIAHSLTHLIMSDLNVEDILSNLKFILKLKQLKHLDISSCREKPPLNRYKNPSLLLAKLVYHLNNLISLDISGTNLTGSSIFKEQEEIEYIKKRLYDDLIDDFNDYQRVKLDQIVTIKSGVAGLMFLNNEKKYLDFFGCFCCDNSISNRKDIPAVKISSETSEAYLFNSLEYHLNDRPLFLLDALNHLFELYRDEFIQDKLLGGHLIMNAMEKHLDNSRIQISGSASLFYVLKYWKEENFQLPYFYLKRLILTVINGMEEHIDESAMRRNCVLIMCRLNLPDDVLFVSDRLIRILLKIFEDYIEDRNKNPLNDRPEHFVLRTAMHLLNILACSVHGSDKAKAGLISIPVAMSLIKTKTKFKEADDILEVTWSFLWNITDETPENCKLFLDSCDGINAFMECIQFKKSEIIRNMMGLLGNVAEVKPLRNRLCKNDLIATFRQLLFHSGDGIEIPYNSAGVLVHIMSDGQELWADSECKDHDRQSVIEDIETAIDKWDLNSERNINYRSFEPIFRLAEQIDNPICQRWACWALANLTTVYPDIYCPLFEKENGKELLSKVLNYQNVNDAIKRYTNIVFENVDKFLKNN